MLRRPGSCGMRRPARLDAPTPIPTDRRQRPPDSGRGAPCRPDLPPSPSPTFFDRRLATGVGQPANHLGTPSC